MEVVGGEQVNIKGEPIDVIVPTHGKLEELTIPCLNALYGHTKNLFHLIVVDDSTPDLDGEKESPTAKWFERFQIDHQNLTFFHSPIPFKSGNQFINTGLSLGNSRFVAIVGNSVMVEPDWDITPISMMAGNPKIGVIGMKCLKLGWPEGDGQIESAGIYMDAYIPCDKGRDEPSHRLSYSYPCFSVQWAFAMIRREAVVGNLDENLWEGHVGWDDIDNSVYLRYKGWEAWYCGLSVGYHRTHATRGSDKPEVLYKNGKNGEVFYKRWGYWDLFRGKNPYSPTYFPDGQIKFLTNANDLPLRFKPLEQVVKDAPVSSGKMKSVTKGKIELIQPERGSRSTK